MPQFKKVPAYLKASEARFNAMVPSAVGDFLTILNAVIPVIGQLIAMCKKPVPPAPPNPEPNPTPVQSAAWQQAHELRYLATQAYTGKGEGFRAAAINNTAKKILKSKKRDGEEITKSESRELASAALHEAYNNDLPTLARAIADGAP